MTQVHAHIHKRKHKTKQTRLIVLLDKLVVIMGIANIFATLPQVLTIWVGRDATGVSSLSWAYYSLFGLVLLSYGLLHGEKPIIATYAGSTVLYIAVLTGSIKY